MLNIEVLLPLLCTPRYLCGAILKKKGGKERRKKKKKGEKEKEKEKVSLKSYGSSVAHSLLMRFPLHGLPRSLPLDWVRGGPLVGSMGKLPSHHASSLKKLRR